MAKDDIGNPLSIFRDIPDIDLNGMVDGENMIEPIDMDAISDDAVSDATDIVDNLSQYYYDEEFMKRNPKLKKRINEEMESLRVLIKMRKADEVTHDILMRAISGNSGNASLYRSLSDMQKTILLITTKIQETTASLKNMLKDYQYEFDFDKEEDELPGEEKSEQDDSGTFRGAKDFIASMKNIDQDAEAIAPPEE